MARIRHIAIQTQDEEATKQFYVENFGLKVVRKLESERTSGYFLTDGHINLAILRFKNDVVAGAERGTGWSGIHHIGFQVESLEETAAKLEKSVARPRDDINVALGLGAGGAPAGHGNVEVRYLGPDNVNFDVSQTGWVGTPSNKAQHGEADVAAETQHVSARDRGFCGGDADGSAGVSHSGAGSAATRGTRPSFQFCDRPLPQIRSFLRRARSGGGRCPRNAQRGGQGRQRVAAGRSARRGSAWRAFHRCALTATGRCA